MEIFARWVGALTRYFDYLGRIGIFALMALVTVNVILRYGWDSISGTYDYVQLLTAVAVGAAVAYTTYERGHIEIELVMERFSERVQGIVGSVVMSICTLFFAMATWQLAVLANDMKVNNEASMTAYVPYWPFLYFLGSRVWTYGIGFACTGRPLCN